ncbi:hypothetical protein F5148DRAFT_1372285 [Russula earlei]|uniref:Uncharacterized protein n=1 Tax=Russula earlei TaxID=71964 RepID=A0ACC0TRA9_9AGAM|nr:hypothetical protein F5148DRAFT_1372285 [Russula earlei]
MRISFIFATFCLAIGVTPSFALPSNSIRTKPVGMQESSGKQTSKTWKVKTRKQRVERESELAKVGDSDSDVERNVVVRKKGLIPFFRPGYVSTRRNAVTDAHRAGESRGDSAMLASEVSAG